MRKPKPPPPYLCTVAISSHENAAVCICDAEVRWGFDGKRPTLVHGKAVDDPRSHPAAAIADGPIEGRHTTPAYA